MEYVEVYVGETIESNGCCTHGYNNCTETN